MKDREKALSIALLVTAVATSLFFTPWEIRWRLFSYLPIVLFLVHVGIFFIALAKPKFWSLFKAYFAVPLVIYLSFALWLASAAQKDTSGWGGIFLPQAILSIPVLPFQLPAIVENQIDRKQGMLRQAQLESGALRVEDLLKEKNELSDREQKGIYRKLSRGDDFSTAVLRSLILDYSWGGSSPNPEIIRLALSHPNTDVETLIDFYKKNKDSNHCTAVARNPKTPQWILKEMSGAKNDYVRLAAVDSGRLNEGLIVEALRMTVESRWIHGRRHVADSEFATSDMLQSLLNDEEYVLEGIAANPKASSEILKELAVRESSKVRAAVISNPAATEEIISIASSGKIDYRVKKALSERQNQTQ